MILSALSPLPTYLRASLIKKGAMAITGLVLLGFVVGHLLGNLQIFLGPQKLNDYAAFLHASPGLLWGTRLVLLLCLLVHVGAAVQLTLQNRAARPQAYATRDWRQTGYASRTMVAGGVIVLLFVAYHLAHLTLGAVGPTFDPKDVYGNVVRGFSEPLIAGLYILAQAALAMHIHHGLWSLFQTVGLNHPKINRCRRSFATAVALGLFIGNSSIPVAVLTGLVK